MRSSDEIRSDIIKQLEWDSRIKAKNITVEVNNHTVILSGNVSSYMQRTAAEADAMNIPGVSDVHNLLNIEPDDFSKNYTDDQILRNIKSIIALNPVLNLRMIELSVENGAVFLSGAVDEFWKKMQAEEIIFDAPGVKKVVNTLSVVPTNAPYDEIIAANILSALQRIPNINLQLINVTVEGGRVTIHGRVPDWNSFSAAHNAAKYTRGVTDLTNKLIIA